MNCKELVGKTITYNGKKLLVVGVIVDILGTWLELENGQKIKYEEEE